MLAIPFRLLRNVIVLALRGLEWLVLWPFVLLRRRQRRFVSVELKGRFRLAPRKGLAGLFGPDHSYAAFDEQLERVERDPDVEGVVVKIVAPTLSLTDASLVQQRLLALRAQGKRVVGFVETGGLKTLVMAAACDTVMMAPAGRLMLPGLAFELTFLRGLLERVGLRGQFIHIGRYKTAGHLFTRRGSTDAQHDVAKELLVDLADSLAEAIRRPDVTWPDDGGPWRQGPLLDIVKARRLGLVDHQAFPDQVRIRLQAEPEGEHFDPFGTFGDDEIAQAHTERLEQLPTVAVHKASDHAKQRPKRLRLVPLVGSRPEIAIVEMSGIILPDEATGGPLGGRAHINPGAVRRVLESLRKRGRVKAVVLAIDSRGGSALASDLIWREVVRLKQHKPVVAVMRSVAASGGYYIAVGAHEIVADALTLTGSIGVVAGKISVGQALDKARIATETLELGDWGTILSTRHPWDADDVEALRRDIRRSYRRFINRVAVSREMPSSRVHLLARGRVYTGRQAASRGLVDTLGTVHDAVLRAAARAELDIERATVTCKSLSKPTLQSLLSGQTSPPLARPSWLGAVEPALDEALTLAALLRRHPVLAYFDGALLNADA